MKRLTAVLALAVGVALAANSAAEAPTGTSGPYAVVMETDPTLPDHTIFRPANLAAVKHKLPVIAFGNGGCVNLGNAFQTFPVPAGSGRCCRSGPLAWRGGVPAPAILPGGPVGTQLTRRTP